MKSNKSTLTTRVFVFVLVTAIFGASAAAWWFDSSRPADSGDTKPVDFTVAQGDGVRTIAANLADQKLIRSSTAFFLLVKLMGIERNLQAGEYRLTRSMDARSVARELTLGISDTWVTTLEGWRREEIATAVAKSLNLPESEFLKSAREGYMFPDTYLVPSDATAGAVIGMFVSEFEKKITPDMRAAITASGRTLDEVIILASLIEREGKSDSDRPVIAGVLVNRLNAEWPLQVDATLQYALGYQPGEKSWWKKALTEDDKSVDSPYNTYENLGLPPGPICNPGLSSIRAAIYPAKTDYMYYIHDRSGGVHFAETLDEHNDNVDTYLR